MKLILVLLAMIFSSSLFAGLLVDPYLGYKTGGYDYTVKNSGVANGPYEYDYSGHEYGLRLGGSFMGFMGGLQYGMGSVEKESKLAPVTVAGSGKGEYDTTLLGAFVGFSGIPFFRVWGSYFFEYKLEASKTNNDSGVTKGDYTKGNGYGLGLGFTGIPFISLNIEYRMITIDKDFDAATNVKTTYPTNTVSETDAKELLFSVSAPFNFF